VRAVILKGCTRRLVVEKSRVLLALISHMRSHWTVSWSSGLVKWVWMNVFRVSSHYFSSEYVSLFACLPVCLVNELMIHCITVSLWCVQFTLYNNTCLPFCKLHISFVVIFLSDVESSYNEYIMFMQYIHSPTVSWIHISDVPPVATSLIFEQLAVVICSSNRSLHGKWSCSCCWRVVFNVHFSEH